MKNLLRPNSVLSKAFDSEVLVWHEEDFYPNGGSKIRMMKAFDDELASIPNVLTSGHIQSNQFRQLAQYCKDVHPNVQVTGFLYPEYGLTLNNDVAVGNLKTGLDLGAKLHYCKSREEAEFKASTFPDKNLLMPRGMLCEKAIAVWSEISEFLPADATVIVVSGSGTTHIGIHRVHKNVVGVCTTKSIKTQTENFTRFPSSLPYRFCDDFLESHISKQTVLDLEEFNSLSPGFQLDPLYTVRLYQWLKKYAHKHKKIVMINTGANFIQDVLEEKMVEYGISKRST